MKDKDIRHIIEDLLPLYAEGMLSDETTAWLEKQAKNNEEYGEWLKLAKEDLPQTELEPPVDSQKMFQKATRKLAMFQIVFVAISFLLAVNTALINESFGFILWYTVLGCITYLFYKDWKIVFYISFLPVFLWSIGSDILGYVRGHYLEGTTIIELVTGTLFGSVLLSFIHLLFAIIGCIIAWIILKLREG
ncbi:MAG: hypothetical protein LRY73_11125 [Bacillus sp. (in: Bacteria)]|nr:hypothetical protein [Bacillus sp. (in: firmicutes)]